MEPFYCPICGHWQTTRASCTAITHNETGGAHRCGCRHERQEDHAA